MGWEWMGGEGMGGEGKVVARRSGGSEKEECGEGRDGLGWGEEWSGEEGSGARGEL